MTDSAELYQALIMDRSKNPRFAGRLADFDAEAEGDNPMCGDRVHIYLRRAGTEITHESRGCAIMTASADLMAEAVAGKTPAQIDALKSAFEAVVTTGEENPAVEKLNALAGVFAYRSRIRCATLPWSALSDAIKEDRNHG